MDLRKTSCEVDLIQNCIQWQALVLEVLNFQVGFINKELASSKSRDYIALNECENGHK
jgi:hypothetical protein